MYTQRRDFLWILGGGIVFAKLGCDQPPPAPAPPLLDGTPEQPPSQPTGDAAAAIDACTAVKVTMHDTYAQALYLDGSLGPLTGVVEVAHVIAGATITLEFWHGHNGVPHRWTLVPQDFAALKRGERITLGTTTVDGHAHTLFIDPVDETYRVPGAPDVPVPLDPC
jgi:hypothetical protein